MAAGQAAEGVGAAVRQAIRRTQVDANQREIVDALRKVGARVYVTGHPYDLLVRYSKQWWIIEVKYGNAGFTPSQTKDMQELADCEHGECPVIVVRNVQDALWALGVCRYGK